jgi:hypothetical protein
MILVLSELAESSSANLVRREFGSDLFLCRLAASILHTLVSPNGAGDRHVFSVRALLPEDCFANARRLCMTLAVDVVHTLLVAARSVCDVTDDMHGHVQSAVLLDDDEIDPTASRGDADEHFGQALRGMHELFRGSARRGQTLTCLPCGDRCIEALAQTQEVLSGASPFGVRHPSER